MPWSRPITLLSLILWVLVGTGGGGCSRRETPVQAGIRTGTLLLGNGQEPQDLDPQIATGFSDYNVLIGLFEGLTCIDEATSRAVAGSAERWEVSGDGLTYRFHLRPGLAWSNGDPLTAEDFVYSFHRMLTPSLAAGYAYLLFPIRNAEAYYTGRIKNFDAVGAKETAPGTLEIQLDHPCPYLPALAAHQAWFPVHRATLEKFDAFARKGTAWTRPANLVGNGAFLLKEWTPNARIVLVRNPRYWDNARNRLNSVVFFPTENIATDENDFRAGQVHITNDLVPEHIRMFQKTRPEVLRIDPLSESDFLRFNVHRAPLTDRRVRRALSLSIDRTAIARDLLAGSRQPAHALTPPNTGGYSSAAQVPTDFPQARRLLADAGYPGGKGFPLLAVQTYNDPTSSKILEEIQQVWRRELGVNATLGPKEFGVYLDSQKTLDYQVSRGRWVGDYDDPSNYLDLFRGDSGNNQTGWSDPAYDRLNDEANRSLDPGRRFALLRQAEGLLLEASPIAPVYFGTRTYLIQPQVKGWVPSLLGIHRYQYVWLEK